MLNILFSILTFNLLIICFKLFERFKVDILQALIFNYLTAGVLSSVYSGTSIDINQIITSTWFYHSIGTGAMFIVVFNMYAYSTQKVGIAVSTVANKMSLIIPVTAALILYKTETLSAQKATGLGLALVGIFLAVTQKGGLAFNKKYLWLVVLVFLGQGVSDLVFNDAKQRLVPDDESMLFFIGLYFMAGLTGVLILMGKSLAYKNVSISPKSFLWGIAFGIPNWACITFFFAALGDESIQSSAVFPLLSIGVVISSALLGWIGFGEKLSQRNWIGILLTVVSIALLSFTIS